MCYSLLILFYRIKMSVKESSQASQVNKNKLNQILTERITDVEMNEVSTAAASNENPTIKDLMKVMLSVDNKVASVNETMSKHIKFVSNEFGRIDKQVAVHTKVIASNAGEIGELRKKVNGFESKSDSLAYTVELNKQQNLRNNITISGIPFTAGENLTNLALAVFMHIGAIVSADDISSSYRFKFGDMFVIKFHKYDTKAAVMEAKSNTEILLADIVGATAESTSSNEKKMVYINTHVIPFFGHLLSRGRRAVKEKQIHSCWMTNNGVVVKLTSESKETIVKTIGNLYQLCGKPLNDHSSTKTKPTSKRTAKDQETSPIDKQKQNKKPANVDEK